MSTPPHCPCYIELIVVDMVHRCVELENRFPDRQCNSCCSPPTTCNSVPNIVTAADSLASLGRPYIVTGGLLFYPWCFSFFLFSPHVLRVPSTDRPETLPPDRNLRVFYNASPKIRGALPQKNLGPKTCKNMQNFGRFWTTSDFDREYLRNG